MRQKYDTVVSALGGAGFSVVQEEWEEREYDYLDGTANAIVEVRANPSACYLSDNRLWRCHPRPHSPRGSLAHCAQAQLEATTTVP